MQVRCRRRFSFREVGAFYSTSWFSSSSSDRGAVNKSGRNCVPAKIRPSGYSRALFLASQIHSRSVLRTSIVAMHMAFEISRRTLYLFEFDMDVFLFYFLHLALF